MHPAFSVIFLTTLIGAGQGLFLALYTAQVYSRFKLLPQHNIEQFYIYGTVIAVALLVAGLIASFFHLGHPERAWRSAAMWRTSWLSREVIALPITMLLIALYGVAHYFEFTQPLFQMPGGTAVDPTLLLGLAATIATFALFVCTGMIYACIKFLQEWHSPLTVINYTLLGTASGFTLATALSAWMKTGLTGFYAGWSLIITVLALIFRLASLRRNRRLRPKSNPKTAIGVRHSNIKQISMGAMGGTFNTREFFHGKKESFVKSTKMIFLVLVFLVPIILLGVTFSNPVYLIPAIAFAIQYLGLLAERWYFFADAKHPQNIYYQSIG